MNRRERLERTHRRARWLGLTFSFMVHVLVFGLAWLGGPGGGVIVEVSPLTALDEPERSPEVLDPNEPLTGFAARAIELVNLRVAAVGPDVPVPGSGGPSAPAAELGARMGHEAAAAPARALPGIGADASDAAAAAHVRFTLAVALEPVSTVERHDGDAAGSAAAPALAVLGPVAADEDRVQDVSDVGGMDAGSVRAAVPPVPVYRPGTVAGAKGRWASGGERAGGGKAGKGVRVTVGDAHCPIRPRLPPKRIPVAW